MKVAILGSNHLAKNIGHTLKEMGAKVLNFCPKETRFHVQKSSLCLDEDILGHGRFYDLFRIVYERTYSQNTLAGVLSKADREHLLRPLETFVDVDMVIDTLELRRSNQRAPLLNENSPPLKGLVSVGKLPNLKQVKYLTYVIHSETCLKLLEPLVSWALEERNQLFIVARYFNPVENHPQWLELMSKVNGHFEKEKIKFEDDIAHWKSLEDYERPKYPRPSQPSAKIQLFHGYWPLGIDYFSDLKKAFLSLERPLFRGGEDLRALEVDHVLFEQGLSSDNNPSFCCFGIRPKETGYFILQSQQHNPQYQDKGNQEGEVGALLQEINKLFTKREKKSLEHSLTTHTSNSGLSNTGNA